MICLYYSPSEGGHGHEEPDLGGVLLLLVEVHVVAVQVGQLLPESVADLLSPLSFLVGRGSEIVLLANYPLNHYAISKFLASCLRTNTRLYTWFKGRAYDLSLILS